MHKYSPLAAPFFVDHLFLTRSLVVVRENGRSIPASSFYMVARDILHRHTVSKLQDGTSISTVGVEQGPTNSCTDALRVLQESEQIILHGLGGFNLELRNGAYVLCIGAEYHEEITPVEGTEPGHGAYVAEVSSVEVAVGVEAGVVPQHAVLVIGAGPAQSALDRLGQVSLGRDFAGSVGPNGWALSNLVIVITFRLVGEDVFFVR